MSSITVWCRRYAVAVLLIVAMRARYLFSPMTSDEGGYLAIARAWSRGATLYEGVWVDRPQGLLAVFALLDKVGLGSTIGLRVFAGVVCVGAAVACGQIAATLVGESERERARWLTAVSVGVLASVPQAEGFIANAELLSCTAGAAALALVLSSVWNGDRRDDRRLVFAGLLGGVALSLKQSGFDALLVGLIALVMVARSRRQWGMLPRRVLLVLGGVSIPVGVMAAHGAVTGWHRWWYAVVGYRIEQRSAVANARWAKFGQSFEAVAPVLSVIVVVCVVLAVIQWRDSHLRPGIKVLGAWTAVSLVAFAVGGNFFRHYWIILMFPLGTLLGVLLSRVHDRRWFAACVVAAAAMPIGLTATALTTPRDRIGEEIHGNSRLVADEEIADWFASRAQPGDQIYALCASAGMYGQIDVDPPFPYLWFDDIRQVPGAVDQLVALFSSTSAPRFVARYQAADLCDPTGRLKSAITTNYRRIAVVSDRIIFERHSR